MNLKEHVLEELVSSVEDPCTYCDKICSGNACRQLSRLRPTYVRLNPVLAYRRIRKTRLHRFADFVGGTPAAVVRRAVPLFPADGVS